MVAPPAVRPLTLPCCVGSHFRASAGGGIPASLAKCDGAEDETSDEAERPEWCGKTFEFLAVVRHLVDQAIRSGIRLPPAGIGGCATHGDVRRAVTSLRGRRASRALSFEKRHLNPSTSNPD